MESFFSLLCRNVQASQLKTVARQWALGKKIHIYLTGRTGLAQSQYPPKTFTIEDCDPKDIGSGPISLYRSAGGERWDRPTCEK
jgi:hypothetical protein